MKRNSFLLIIAAVLAISLIGCGESDLGTTVDNTKVSTPEAEIAKIEANPNMPPQAKEAAIGQIKARAEAAKAQAEAVSKSKK